MAGAAGACVASTIPLRSARAATTPIAPASCPVEHLVLLMMENRSFDHMLGRLDGVNGLARFTSCQDDDGVPVYAHRFKDMACTVGDLPHGYSDGITCWNHGKNDGFVRSNGTQSMGYMSPREVPWIYALASQYTVLDRWHCSLLAGTWPNRRYSHAGSTSGSRDDDFPPGKIGYHERTVFHQLAEAGLDWSIYFTDVPFPALYPEVLTRWTPRFKAFSRFYDDAAAGTLSPVTVLEPGYLIGTDDHPPRSTQVAQRLMADVVCSLVFSPLWPKTALLITYDEWGGFFDHVSPPNLADDFPDLGKPVGFRVPALVVSPWARRGAVSSAVKDHTSWLKLVQWRFGLPALTKRNAKADNVLEAFDFTSPMRTDLPALPVPTVDQNLADVCWIGDHLRPEHDYQFDMPGGEGPESDVAWWRGSPEGAASAPGKSAKAIAESAAEAPAPDVDGVAARAAQNPVGLARLFESALDVGAIPREFDLRPAAGSAKPMPSPFLQPGSLPTVPAWHGRK